MAIDRHRPGYLAQYYREHRAERLEYARKYREECRDVIRAKAREKRRYKGPEVTYKTQGGQSV